MHTSALTIHTLQHIHLTTLFARGGGGGSGGGGSGGSGGGGGIILFGYLPAYYVTSWCNKKLSARSALAAGIATTLLITIGVGMLDVGLGIILGIAAGFGVYGGLHNIHTRLLRRAKLTKKVLTYAASQDPVWHEAKLMERVSQVFYQFQQDWSQFNLKSMRSYTSPKFYEHQRLLLAALYQMGRRNEVSSPSLKSAVIVDATDAHLNDDDNFMVAVQASARDVLLDTIANKEVYTDKSDFNEFWHFDRQGDEWVLNGIRQSTENSISRLGSLSNFAAQHDMFYSPDMGWLLLPQRGQLFGHANFKRSDINNHVIGEIDGTIVQLYTYVPFKARESADNYLVGQINLPKQYGGIIIKRRKGIGLFDRPGGYQTMSYEWPDFNKRYRVYATDMDKVTSFELLNPKFMADLYDKKLSINIEVVDNIVYFYCKLSNANLRYFEMLEILRGAYDELKR